jgi:uncharacterized protein with FMN-binding domain
MKRAIAAIASTIAGLVLLLGFKTGQPPAVSPQAPGGTTAGPGATSAPGRPGLATRTATGRAVPIPFGAVQVRVTADGRHITGVSAVQLPHDNPFSALISKTAGPHLRREALTAQSAHIHAVSGATYTSDGYAQSLQSALDKLHI